MTDPTFNGEPVSSGIALTRGLQYGDGVFRTLLMRNGFPADWPRQYAKLQQDAARLDLQAPDADLLKTELDAGAGSQPLAVAKIILSRRSTGRGYAPGGSQTDRWIIHASLPEQSEAYWQQGIRLFRSPVVLSAQPLLAGIKHLNRLEQVLASRDWPAGVQEAVMCDVQSAPVCGTRSNLFWVRRGQLITPPLRDCGVSGMMRQKIQEQAMALDIPCGEDHCRWQELLEADEIFVSNSLIGIWPVCELESFSSAAPGPLTRRLMVALQHPWQGGH